MLNLLKIKKQIIMISFGLGFILSAGSAEASGFLSTDDTTGQWWLNLGGGIGRNLSSDNGGGAALYGSFNFRLSQHQLLTVRAFHMTDLLNDNPEISFVCDLARQAGKSCQIKDATENDVAAMYGLIAKGQYAYISGSTGIAYVNGQNDQIIIDGHSAAGGDNFSTIGLPLEVQAFLTPFQYVGVGLVGFGDLNSKKSTAGLALAIQFGHLGG